MAFVLRNERWIVYPLLMLSLFSSLVGVQVIKAQQEVLDSITTRALIVVDDNGNTVATLKKQSDGYGGTFLDIFHDDMPTASIRGGKAKKKYSKVQ